MISQYLGGLTRVIPNMIVRIIVFNPRKKKNEATDSKKNPSYTRETWT